jgi:hypothetical protein
MRNPPNPPAVEHLTEEWSQEDARSVLQRIQKIYSTGASPTPDGRYLAWDQLKYRKPPAGLTSEEWWYGVSASRQLFFKPLAIKDTRGRPFQFMQPDIMLELLHYIDRYASGAIGGQFPEQVTNPGMRNTYIMKSLIEEAITSSQLEGAATTRAVAKDMLQTGRLPRDRGERMIYNNFKALHPGL